MTEELISAPLVNTPDSVNESAITTSVDVAEQAAECGFTLIEAQGLASDIIALMGGCFILGSFVTVFCLLILDFVRRNKPEQ